MTDAILLMLGTGVIWALVGVVFGSAPSDRDRMFSFFAIYQTLFCAFVWIAQPPAAAPAGEVLRLSRDDFYARAKAAFAIVQSGETAQYGNVILKKGNAL